MQISINNGLQNNHDDDDNEIKETHQLYCTPNEFDNRRYVLRKGSLEA